MAKRHRVNEIYQLAPGQVLHGESDYEIQRSLRRGSSALAYQAITPSGEPCFIKEYLPPDRPSLAEEVQHVYDSERDVLKRIGIYELCPRFWDDFSQDGYQYLVTELIPGDDLETVISADNKQDQETIVRWCVCLCHILSFLHNRSVVHHDLKPANIRLNQDGDPVLVDFGAAHWYRRPEETTDVLFGSDSYLAPEYRERTTEDLPAGKQMDVFAMGRIMVELMVGERFSQDQIDQRQQQIYGSILHDGDLDISFVRAVFKAIEYDPQRRYASGVEMAEDITPAAPPLGRLRPQFIDFGAVSDIGHKEDVVVAYNVGGGALRADVAVEGDWLEISAESTLLARAQHFERNRQPVRVVANPELIRPGETASGRVVFTFNNNVEQVPVRIHRAAAVSAVTVSPSQLHLNAPAGGWGKLDITFQNSGAGAANVQLQPPNDLMLEVDPESFLLPPGAKQVVTLSVDASVLGENRIVTEVGWSVDGNARPPLPLAAEARSGMGLLAGLAGRFRRKKH